MPLVIAAGEENRHDVMPLNLATAAQAITLTTTIVNAVAESVAGERGGEGGKRMQGGDVKESQEHGR